VNASASEEVATALVVLKGGLTVPLEALQLAWALENRGVTLAVDDIHLVVDSPRGLLTDADQAAIRRWKRHLMAIAAYRPPEVVE
jgi:hypothetical protein